MLASLSALSSSLRKRARSYVRRVLAARGYQLQRLASLDMRRDEASARDLVLRSAAMLGQSLVAEVPVARCRSATGVALNEQHPFVLALSKESLTSFSGSVLEAYYRRCQPTTAAEVLGVSEVEAPGFASLPPAAFVMPWYEAEPEEMMNRRAMWMKAEGSQYGRDLVLQDGLSLFGPVSDDKGEMEAERLTRIYRSVRRKGFWSTGKKGGNVEGWVLTEADGDWCVLITAGQHRIGVAAALGIARIPVHFRYAPVCRETVAYWPQVVAGRITPEGALGVFDRTLRGQPSPDCHFIAAA